MTEPERPTVTEPTPRTDMEKWLHIIVARGFAAIEMGSPCCAQECAALCVATLALGSRRKVSRAYRAYLAWAVEELDAIAVAF